MAKKHPVILVVEDEMPIQKAIQTKLMQSGFEVVCVRGVAEAMKELEDEPKKDAIWLDHYLLGNQDGLDFVSSLKAKESKWKKIPILVVSNSASDEKVRSYLELGVNNYFTKSDHPLAEIIGNMIELLK